MADLSAKYLFETDEQLKDVDRARWTQLPSKATLESTIVTMETKGYIADIFDTKKEACDALIAALPKNSSVNIGGSRTLKEIGFISYLKDAKDIRNLHGQILAAPQEEQGELRRIHSVCDVFVSSVDAVTQDGGFLVSDLTGTRVGPFLLSASKVFVVVSAHKIVKDMKEARERLQEFCVPVESARVRVAYGVKASFATNVLEIMGSNPFAPKRFHFFIVNEEVGF